MDDARLVVRCQLGEREAFTELVGGWHVPLHRYLRGMTGSPDLADDLAQECWVAVLRGLPRLRHPERFPAWLFTIARRTVTDRLRAAYAAPPPAAWDAEPEAPAADPGRDPVLDAAELRAGVDALPPREREVLVLYHLADQPVATCAEVLGVPEGTVKSRLHRGRRLLRDILTERGFPA